MKNLLIALFVGMPLVGCTEKIVTKPVPPPAAAPGAETEETADGTEPTTEETADAGKKPGGLTAPEDTCLDGQDMDADDVDVSSCPALPSIPKDITIPKGFPLAKEKISLGAWEIGTTADGETYKYGTLGTGTTTRTLSYDGGSTEVNAENLECWAKGYYRLRKILQDAPAEYVKLYEAGFQYRFFQFQTDLRNGPTGYKAISSFEDHLVKWVTIVNSKGVCEQPTLTKFRDYVKSELKRRKID